MHSPLPSFYLFPLFFESLCSFAPLRLHSDVTLTLSQTVGLSISPSPLSPSSATSPSTIPPHSPTSIFPFAFCPSPLFLGSQSSCSRHVCQFGWSGSRRRGNAETGGSRREGAMEGRRDRCTRREIVAERWRDI